MENCCIYTEAKGRNRYRSQIYLADMCPARTLADLPHTPCHFRPNPMKRSELHSKRPISPIETKDLHVPSFRVFSKNKALTARPG
jgi:hypothetical protein